MWSSTDEFAVFYFCRANVQSYLNIQITLNLQIHQTANTVRQKQFVTVWHPKCRLKTSDQQHTHTHTKSNPCDDIHLVRAIHWRSNRGEMTIKTNQTRIISNILCIFPFLMDWPRATKMNTFRGSDYVILDIAYETEQNCCDKKLYLANG